MILFKPECKSGQAPAPCVILFGFGLIGRAIASKLTRHANYKPMYTASQWGKSENIHIHEKVVCQALALCPPGMALEIIWTAGCCGFNASADVAAQELKDFSDHLRMFSEAAGKTGHAVNFRLISSAGGLFEGQRMINADTPPAPKRCYGHLKLNMEKELAVYPFRLKQILRLTSAFGPIFPGQRQGLITALLENGIKRRITTISGNIDTLRDYVFTEDIASFLTREIFLYNEKQGLEIIFLTAGKPSSTGEIIYHVENTLGRKLLLNFSLTPSNRDHITCRRTLTHQHFENTPLPVAINMIYHKYWINNANFRPQYRQDAGITSEGTGDMLGRDENEGSKK